MQASRQGSAECISAMTHSFFPFSARTLSQLLRFELAPVLFSPFSLSDHDDKLFTVLVFGQSPVADTQHSFLD